MTKCSMFEDDELKRRLAKVRGDLPKRYAAVLSPLSLSRFWLIPWLTCPLAASLFTLGSPRPSPTFSPAMVVSRHHANDRVSGTSMYLPSKRRRQGTAYDLRIAKEPRSGPGPEGQRNATLARMILSPNDVLNRHRQAKLVSAFRSLRRSQTDDLSTRFTL